jgi:hypothetical protein
MDFTLALHLMIEIFAFKLHMNANERNVDITGIA